MSTIQDFFNSLNDADKIAFAHSHDEHGEAKSAENDCENCGSFWACNYCNDKEQKYGCPFGINHLIS